MTKGIYTNWKLPLAYYFVYNSCPAIELKNITQLCIEKLDSIDLHVRVVVTTWVLVTFLLAIKLILLPNDPYFKLIIRKLFICLMCLILLRPQEIY